MAVYLVAWNINKEGTKYNTARAALIKQIETYTNTHDPGLESVRFVSTTSSASAVSDKLRKVLDDDDRIFVTKLVAGGHAGWLQKSVWSWINARI
ncbi:hypothetical protein [Roseobacter sp. CCS2]|uniref:hypothetical protein n=1 Tax=Roseobacter sp. CCS2 TaxID=391593 RepID=UPI0000F3C7A0|nr:hypothetical protein [Roseobacter sp. CCS2]EBA11725.1 hypothetical protein RCCS2_17391 [Roseobacter sp. CCS2]